MEPLGSPPQASELSKEERSEAEEMIRKLRAEGSGPAVENGAIPLVSIVVPFWGCLIVYIWLYYRGLLRATKSFLCRV